MRVPRDWSGEEVIKRLKKLGYEPTRQTGSHVRLTRSTAEGDQHITVPMHRALRIGTLNSILQAVAAQVGKSKEDVLHALQ
jgi:predicted RNA binding protein YcfA (HicA-like mRNA interferase family)